MSRANEDAGLRFVVRGNDLDFKNDRLISVSSLAITKHSYKFNTSLESRQKALIKEFGNNATHADFSDVSDAAEIIGCPLFIDLLELRRVRNPEIGAYQMVEHWNQGPFITYKGKVPDGARSYFISVHDGALLDDWRVVDTIANHALDVGSWYFDRPILAKIKKVFTPHLVNGHTALKSIP